MTQQISLPARLDFDAARDLHRQFSAARGQPLELDVAAVAQVGALAAQLLIVAHRQWQADGLSFRLLNLTTTLPDGFVRLGMDFAPFTQGAPA